MGDCTITPLAARSLELAAGEWNQQNPVVSATTGNFQRVGQWEGTGADATAQYKFVPGDKSLQEIIALRAKVSGQNTCILGQMDAVIARLNAPLKAKAEAEALKLRASAAMESAYSVLNDAATNHLTNSANTSARNTTVQEARDIMDSAQAKLTAAETKLAAGSYAEAKSLYSAAIALAGQGKQKAQEALDLAIAPDDRSGEVVDGGAARAADAAEMAADRTKVTGEMTAARSFYEQIRKKPNLSSAAEGKLVIAHGILWDSDNGAQKK